MAISNLFARFLRENGAVATIEFAVLAPVLISILLGTMEISRYVRCYRQAQEAASQILQIVSVEASSPIGDADLNNAVSVTGLGFTLAQLQANASSQTLLAGTVSVTVSSIEFVSTCVGATCTYKGYVVWSSGAQTKRACGLQTSLATTTPSLLGIPSQLYGPSSILVVDVVYTYTPMFPNIVAGFASSITMHTAAYAQPRNVSTLMYAATGGSNTTACSYNVASVTRRPSSGLRIEFADLWRANPRGPEFGIGG